MAKSDKARGNGRVVAVVVTYNRLQKLQATIARLLDSAVEDLAGVVVVDNMSTDGTGDWLDAQTDPRLFVHRPNKNLGGAGGFERGMRGAVADHDPDWVLLMDDDARPAPGALSAFQAMSTDGFSAVAAAVYYPDGGPLVEMNRPSRNPFWSPKTFWGALRKGRPGFHITDAAYVGTGQTIDVTSFVGLFLSRDAIRRAGYPNGALFVYAEDAIYTLSISAAGGRIWFAPDVRFEHDCGTFSGRRFSPLWKVYYYHRNLLILYRKAAGVLFFPACAVILPKWLLSVRHHRGDGGIYLRLLRRAIIDGLRKNTDTRHDDILALASDAPSRAEIG